MLIDFTVENFACFRDEIMLSMQAMDVEIDETQDIWDIEDQKLTWHQNHEIPCQTDAGFSFNLLPVATVYGSNGHGKTKLVRAISFAQALVRQGELNQNRFSFSEPSFRLHSSYLSKPSYFEFRIFCKKNIYLYGFEIKGDIVTDEWLFIVPGQKDRDDQLIFERKTDPETKKVKITFGEIDALDVAKMVEKMMQANQFFLSKGVKNNVHDLDDVYEWICKKLFVLEHEMLFELTTVLYENRSPQDFEEISQLIQQAGIGIEKICMMKRVADAETMNFFKRQIRQNTGGRNAIPMGPFRFLKYDEQEKCWMTHEVIACYLDQEKKPIHMSLEDDESAGTRQLMCLLPFLLFMKDNDMVVLIDELDRALHPVIAHFFLKEYLSRAGSYKARTQLILTTHESVLVDLELLRPDEIWFLDKNIEGNVQAISLADFDFPQHVDMQRAFLQGRFGGTPMIDNLVDM
ncbi:AAA family ATPase [Magnetococcales bacterium HHB-1]